MKKLLLFIIIAVTEVISQTCRRNCVNTKCATTNICPSRRYTDACCCSYCISREHEPCDDPNTEERLLSHVCDIGLICVRGNCTVIWLP
jgi:hypothetical protein